MKRTIERITFEDGAADDLSSLARYHYHSGNPATRARMITAFDHVEGRRARLSRPVGVLVVSYPVLNAAWREQPFPGRYHTRDRRADAKRLNAEVRTISRVIVEPRYRGIGIGAALVKRYLDNPLTPITEAVAAMGMFTGFFRAAGMIAYTVCPTPRDVRLADAVATLGIEPWMLADPELIPARIVASPLLTRELHRWAKGVPRHLDGAAGNMRLLRIAARVFHPPTAFVAVRGPA